MLKLLVFLGILASAVAMNAQTSLMVNLSGTGTPASNGWPCDSTHSNQIYIQTDASTGRFWACDNSSGSYAWDHLLSAVLGIATTGTFAAQSFLAGGCTSILTVTINGAVVGTNTATASPIFATAPTGNVALLNVIAWVSAANTVSVQGCAVGILATQPTFTAKVLMY